MRRVSLVLLSFAVLVLAGAGASSAAHDGSATSLITSPPAFTADQMNAPAGDNWLSNMGNLKGDRYSSLTQITPANVSQLVPVWKTGSVDHINLGTCLTKDAQCGSFEGNAAVYDGTYYIQTPKSDVFALNAATGATLWHYSALCNGPPEAVKDGVCTTSSPTCGPTATPTSTCYDVVHGFTVGTGGRQPGVAIGDGRIYAARRDGTMVALDPTTGNEIWKVELLPWQKGGRVSDAPIYVNGIVISGDSGGDGGSPSNSMQAFDARSGARLWQWTVIPRLGQPGSNTWPAADAAFSSAYGGGALWESPIIDTKNSLAIFGTGNTEPWNSRGPGKNYYTDSIVALNLYTGQLVWAYQTTHHDMWDSDLPNNGVMFDAPFKVTEHYTAKVRVKYKARVRRHGKFVRVTKYRIKKVKKTRKVTKTQPGVAYVNKYGWTFVLNRLTGKPLLPIKEVKVPTLPNSPDVNAWPTQPVPQVDFVTDDVIAKDGTGRNCSDGNQTQTNFYQPFGTATDPILQKPFKIGCVYDPYDTTQQVVTPFEEMDWPASSYSPENHTMITCGVSKRSRGFLQVPKASQRPNSNGGIGAGIQGTGDTSTSNWGNFTAFDVTTGKRTGGNAWHQRWDAPCYSGSMNTASGITFVGHLGQQPNGQDGKGYLEAVNTKTGASLWKSPPMSAPVGAAPVTYTVNGKQYVSVAVGGQSHNDVSRPFGLTDPRRLRDDAIYTFALP
jgi:quinohemoprotein ethanol dehydrogenase